MRISFSQSAMPATRYDYPTFSPDEQLLLRGQAAFRSGPFGGWRLARAFLTDRRLILYRRPKILNQVSLQSIKDLSVERHYCVLKVRETLRISYVPAASGRQIFLWFVIDGMRFWKEKIHQLSLLNVDKQTLRNLSLRLDADGRQVLWYLWERGHASVRELSALTGADDPMETLSLIRETINPAAGKLLGCPVLVFERSKVHPQTGETIPFHWWLVGRENRCAWNTEQFQDIFDEGEQIVVILGVRRVVLSDIRLDVEGNRLTVRSHRIGAAMRVRIPLPHSVASDGVAMRLKNGFLEVRLPKLRCLAAR
jgi:hypothetical protein